MDKEALIGILKAYWWLAALIIYFAVAIICGIGFHANGIERPILRAIIWPIPIIRLLLGGTL